MERFNSPEVIPEHPVKTEIEEQFYYIVEEIVKTEEMGSDSTQTTLPEWYSHSEISAGERSELSEVISQSNDIISLSLRCRLCAIAHNDMIDVFRPNIKGPSISEKIEHCLCIMVRESDSLPKRVCLLCLEKLEMCYNFNEAVAEAEKQLLAFDKELKVEKTERCENLSVYNAPCDATDDCYIERTVPTQSSTKERRITDTVEVIDLTSESSNPRSIELDPIALDPTKTPCKNNLNKVRKRNINDNEQYVTIPWRYDDIETSSKIDPDIEMKYESRSVEFPEVPATNTTSQCNLQSTCVSEGPEVDPSRSQSDKISSGRSNKASKNMAQSASHAPVHIRERPYKCNVCAKMFNSKKCLNRHTKFHTGKGLFSCGYCGRKFVSRVDRNRHHIVHNGQRPFKCSICDMTFGHEISMKRHAVVHSQVRNYPCSLCDMSFKTEAVRRKHMLVHSSEAQWHCNNCETRFESKDKLLRHMREVHFSLYTRNTTGVR